MRARFNYATGKIVCLVVLIAGCSLLFAAPARACMVCIPFPEETVVDVLLGADVVVLARENPDKPFSYLAAEVIKGNLNNPEIDLFVTSSMRRRLNSNPQRYALLALQKKSSEASGSGSTGNWRPLGYANERYEKIARDVVTQSARWRDRQHAGERAAYFMPYLADADRNIHEIAYLEIGKAPYDTIREADGFVSPDQISNFLSDPLYLEWQRLYILLLGFEAAPEEANLIRERMADLARYDTDFNLSAWATALIEVDGTDAIDWLQRHYLENPGRNSTIVLEAVKAMSVHGSRNPAPLRNRIAEAYAALVQAHPDLSGWVARDLTAWQDWRFADALEEVRKTRKVTDGPSVYAIDYYVGRSRSSY